jgi:hypothetical protein
VQLLQPRDLDLTLRQKERLERLWKRYNRDPLPTDLRPVIKEMFELDITADHGPLELPNPFIVASGEMSQDIGQITKAAEAGWGAVVLRTLAAEDANGNCSLAHLRAKPNAPGTPSHYAPGDKHKERPIVKWYGKVDPRPLSEYLEFAKAAVDIAAPMVVIGSIAAGSDDEWLHTSSLLRSTGIVFLENLPTADSPWNLDQMGDKEKESVIPKLPSGGIYTGFDALNYIVSGASAVQVYSFLAGKVKTPPKRSFNKFEQVLYTLILEPTEGLIAGLLHLKNTQGIDSVREAVGVGSDQ